jgi:hypothetical protein
MNSNYDWLEELLAKTSPGPWEVVGEYDDGEPRPDTSRMMRSFNGDYLGIMQDPDAKLAALAPALAREVLRIHKGLPAPSRGMTPSGAVWYLAGPIGDIRATSGGHVVMFGHGHQHDPFRVVLTSAEAENIAGALLAAANHAGQQAVWAAMSSDEQR